jgi:hypothetical protein
MGIQLNSGRYPAEDITQMTLHPNDIKQDITFNCPTTQHISEINDIWPNEISKREKRHCSTYFLSSLV